MEFHLAVRYSLTPIALFLLMGEILLQTGVAFKAIGAIERMISRIPGRLSVVSIVGGTVFFLAVRVDHRQHRHPRQCPAAGYGEARLQAVHLDGADHGGRRHRHADPALGAGGAARQHCRKVRRAAAGCRHRAGHPDGGPVLRLCHRALRDGPEPGAGLRSGPEPSGRAAHPCNQPSRHGTVVRDL